MDVNVYYHRLEGPSGPKENPEEEADDSPGQRRPGLTNSLRRGRDFT
jgi:hypothetical protein